MKRRYRQLPGGGFVEIGVSAGNRPAAPAIHDTRDYRLEREKAAQGEVPVAEVEGVMADHAARRAERKAAQDAQRKADVAEVVRWASVSGIARPHTESIDDW